MHFEPRKTNEQVTFTLAHCNPIHQRVADRGGMECSQIRELANVADRNLVMPR